MIRRNRFATSLQDLPVGKHVYFHDSDGREYPAVVARASMFVDFDTHEVYPGAVLKVLHNDTWYSVLTPISSILLRSWHFKAAL